MRSLRCEAADARPEPGVVRPLATPTLGRGADPESACHLPAGLAFQTAPLRVARLFTVGALLIGLLAGFVVGLSKTGLPGAALIAVPMLATVFDGRMIAGGTLPILLVADLFAVSWYRRHARWDVLRPLAPWIGLGYAVGVTFFVAVGTATDVIEATIGVIILGIVGLQVVRMRRRRPPTGTGRTIAASHGTIGGFTTFVANAAGPVINTYLLRLGLPKHELVGTSAWLYLTLNMSKIPLYAALGAWTAGGPFFTAESLLFDLAVMPGVLVGVVAGRVLFRHLPQQLFTVIVLTLSAAGAIKLLV